MRCPGPTASTRSCRSPSARAGLVTLRSEERKRPAFSLSLGDCDRRAPRVHRRRAEATVRRRGSQMALHVKGVVDGCECAIENYRVFGFPEVTAALATGVVAALGAGWLWIWQHVNPQFDYMARPAEIASDGSNRSPPTISPGRHWFGLGQIIKQIDDDSRVYCTGGWDQRLGWVGLRACYRFQFTPVDVIKLYVCATDPRSANFSTTDQFLALRFFKTRFAPTECIKITRTGPEAYEITPGKDARPRVIPIWK
jgi:hypothetical protein